MVLDTDWFFNVQEDFSGYLILTVWEVMPQSHFLCRNSPAGTRCPSWPVIEEWSQGMRLFILELTEGFPGMQNFQCPNQELQTYSWPTGSHMSKDSQREKPRKVNEPGHNNG